MMRSTVTGKALPVLGGALCLDFVNTIDPRHKAPREEFLGNFEQLAEWAQFVGLLTPAERRALATRTGRTLAVDVHRRAIALRESLYQLLRKPRARAAPSLALLNTEYRRTAPGLGLEPGNGGYRLKWRSTAPAERLIGPIARSAVELLASAELRRVRECAGDGCGWLFLDNSKAHRRRWCSMQICGNRAKARRRRGRTGA
jgi:predicted RNA-binding Zn ribbon-like protein